MAEPDLTPHLEHVEGVLEHLLPVGVDEPALHDAVDGVTHPASSGPVSGAPASGAPAGTEVSCIILGFKTCFREA